MVDFGYCTPYFQGILEILGKPKCSEKLFGRFAELPFSQDCVLSSRGHYKNVLWSVDILTRHDFTRLSVIEMTLSDMGLIDTFRITNYVKGFTHISFERFAYRREELSSNTDKNLVKQSI